MGQNPSQQQTEGMGGNMVGGNYNNRNNNNFSGQDQGGVPFRGYEGNNNYP
jgi:hypothetical protein